MIRTFAIVLLAAGLVSSAYAESPQACDPKEDPIVCSLKIERNNALDELAINQGNAWRERDTAAAIAQKLKDYWAGYVKGVGALNDWWRDYVAGLPNPADLDARMTPVCSWHGGLNAPTAELCKWWQGAKR